ncbi:MAG: VWA domain-containing protein, partial [Phycisphaerae bacterium]|nr:VWA domain-containing protein [Phycisphaerae bacterium]
RGLLLIDRSASMSYGRRFGSKLDYVARLSAALAYLMLSRGESVGLATFDDDIDAWIPPRSHGRQLTHLIDALARLSPNGAGHPDTAFRQIADRLGRRGLIIILSDFLVSLPTLRQGLARLRHHRHELILIQVLDRDELTFPFTTAHRFVGMEGERPALLEPATMRQAYLDRLANHQRLLARLCRSMHAELYTYRTDRLPIESLTDMIRRRTS